MIQPHNLDREEVIRKIDMWLASIKTKAIDSMDHIFLASDLPNNEEMLAKILVSISCDQKLKFLRKESRLEYWKIQKRVPVI